ncbi:hypothetical protein [Mesorhizobium sp. M0207]|uniref:hypothetical protein n=1 Tax=Mesorhizobium sp. M0207 TaxID=2956915 RepID=UPI003337E801
MKLVDVDRRRFEENMLFNRSIRENIALADPAIPMERASLAGVHDFILRLPAGYNVSTASLPAPGSPASRDMASHRTDTLILEAADASALRQVRVIPSLSMRHYDPVGSLKAQICVAGREQLYRLCERAADSAYAPRQAL